MWALVSLCFGPVQPHSKKWEEERQHSSLLMLQELAGDMHWCYELLINLFTGADYWYPVGFLGSQVCSQVFVRCVGITTRTAVRVLQNGFPCANCQIQRFDSKLISVVIPLYRCLCFVSAYSAVLVCQQTFFCVSDIIFFSLSAHKNKCRVGSDSLLHFGKKKDRGRTSVLPLIFV